MKKKINIYFRGLFWGVVNKLINTLIRSRERLEEKNLEEMS